MEQDHVDRLLAKVAAAGADLDLDVEGIVDRMSMISKRVRSALKETLEEYGITPEDLGVMSRLRLGSEDFCSTPGELAGDLELSSGAMTSRLDRLERAGYVRRKPDPDDRRGVLVELTAEGRETWENAIAVQGRKEAFSASALTKPERKRLNDLLRKIALALEATATAR